MWTDKELETLEKSEHSFTLEQLAIMALLLNETKGDIETELIRFYNDYGNDGVVTYAEARKYVSSEDRRRRISVLLLFLSTEFGKLNNKLQVKFQSLEDRIFKMEFDFFNTEKPQDFTKIPWGVDELTWEERLKNDVDLWWKYVGIDLKRSMTRGDTLDDVLKQLGKRFITIENVLNRLGITEASAMNTIARQEIFDQLNAKKFRYYTLADERTCEVCGAMHGLTFPTSAYEIGVTAPPIHPFVDALRRRLWTRQIRKAK